VPDHGWFLKAILGYNKSNSVYYRRRIGPAHADILRVHESKDEDRLIALKSLIKLCDAQPLGVATLHLKGAVRDYTALPAVILMRDVAKDAHKMGSSPGCICPYGECPAGMPARTAAVVPDYISVTIHPAGVPIRSYHRSRDRKRKSCDRPMYRPREHSTGLVFPRS
jgi:hypothetical protein